MNLKSSIEFGKFLKDRSDSEYRKLRENYDAFLERKLSIGMLIPCDLEGNVLEEPTQEKYGWYSASSPEEQSGWMFEEGESKYYEAIKKWEEALENVLFKFGFIKPQELMEQFSTIEGLANFYEPELTPSALKEIGVI